MGLRTLGLWVRECGEHKDPTRVTNWGKEVKALSCVGQGNNTAASLEVFAFSPSRKAPPSTSSYLCTVCGHANATSLC
jgi:hypothetical protein